MRVVYSDQELIDVRSAKSIFLAGPTPRSPEVKSWRPEALKILEGYKFDGIVFVPEYSDGKPLDSYNNQIAWEHTALELATVVMFWIPRNLTTLPGFTTNIEFGFYAKSGKIVLGAPLNTPKMTYIVVCAREFKIPHAFDLSHTVSLALDLLKQK